VRLAAPVGRDRRQIERPGNRSDAHRVNAFRQPAGALGHETGPGLKCGLIHPHPAPFTDRHPGRIRAGRGRWRSPVNAGQHCWKACWGQPLASSNLASSAHLTCGDAVGSWSRATLHRTACVSFSVSVAPRPYVLFRTDRCDGTLRCTRCTWSATSRTYLNGMVHAAEACAPPFRAGRDRPRPGCRLLLHGQMSPLADRITLCDREARGEPAPQADPENRRPAGGTWPQPK
jgi:hypothetical protein